MRMGSNMDRIRMVRINMVRINMVRMNTIQNTYGQKCLGPDLTIIFDVQYSLDGEKGID